MSLNRVIGANNQLPWHIPEELKWFKELTMGHAIVMGRKTFESIGRALPGRTSYVFSRGEFNFPGVTTIRSLGELDAVPPEKEIFIIGGAQIFELAFPQCSDLFLTVVKREVSGDTFMPPFEDRFEFVKALRQTDQFEVRHYRNKLLN